MQRLPVETHVELVHMCGQVPSRAAVLPRPQPNPSQQPQRAALLSRAATSAWTRSATGQREQHAYSALERSWVKCRETIGSKGDDCIEYDACAWCCARRPEAPASAAQPALSAPPQLHMHGRWGAKERPQINVLPACCHCASSHANRLAQRSGQACTSGGAELTASLTFLGRHAAHHTPEPRPAHSLLPPLLTRPTQLVSGWQDLASGPQLLRVRALCQHQAVALVAAAIRAGASKGAAWSAGL